MHEPHSMLRILRSDETPGHDSSGDDKAILNDTFAAPAASNAFFVSPWYSFVSDPKKNMIIKDTCDDTSAIGINGLGLRSFRTYKDEGVFPVISYEVETGRAVSLRSAHQVALTNAHTY